MNKLLNFGLAIVTIAMQAVGWYMSGQIGWERGNSYANWEAHYNAAQNRQTMKKIGTCRWAQLEAGCDWRDTKPH